MNTEALSQVVNEFLEYELDPGKLNTKKIHDTLMMIKDTLDLSSPANILSANSVMASLVQVISFKANKCSYWEKLIESKLDHERLQAKYRLIEKGKAESVKYTKEYIDDQVELDATVVEIKERYMSAKLGRMFWDRMLDTLSSVSHRVDSAGMQLGVQAKLRPQGN